MTKLSEIKGKAFRATNSDVEEAIKEARQQAQAFINDNPNLEYLNETFTIVPKFFWRKYFVMITITYK